MYWNYRVAKKKRDDVIVYGLVEVYYNDEGEAEGWTDFVSLEGEDELSLKADLELMLHAFSKPTFEKEITDEN